MPADNATILILDDNLGDIHLLTTAWTEGRYDETVGIHACTACTEAVDWLANGKPPSCVVRGVLVNLMLYDADGRAASDLLGEQPALEKVPIIAWTGLDVGKWHTDRMRRTRRIWKKPNNWLAFADFTQRLYRAFAGISPDPDAVRSIA